MQTKDYPYLRAWCKMMGSYDYYLQAQLEKARKDKAPEDAIYYRNFSQINGWVCFADVTNKDIIDIFNEIMREKV